MNLLLDTHVWLWGLLAPEKLSAKARKALGSPEADLFLSPISVWEALLLAERGRVRVEGNPHTWLDGVLKADVFREVPLTIPVALASRRLPLTIEDPADRFLAATASVYGLTFVTADRHLRRIPGVEVLPA